MRYLILTFFALLMFACQQQDASSFSEEPSADNWLAKQRLYPHNKIDQDAQIAAKAWKREAIRSQAASRSAVDSWELMGPTNIGGRITDVEMPADDLNTIYVGTAAGGVFKTDDGGTNWDPIFDDAESLSIGDMALAPSNQSIIYVGTGECNGGGGSLTYDGYGVYRSNDAGATWAHAGLENVGTIGRVVVHPTQPDIAYVGATGNLFSKNENRGLYKTVDGGISWDKVLFINDSTGVVDVAIHPTEPDILYVATWERTRTVNRITYGGAGSGVYKTIDGGANWTELTNGLPTNPALTGRIALAIAPSAPEVVYASFARAAGSQEGFYRSADGGDSWIVRNSVDIIGTSFMWWFGRINVAPNDPQIVHFSGFINQKTTDGGQNWQETFVDAHVDQHATFIHPLNPDFVLAANDGGLYKSTDGGLNYEHFTGLPITQFYACSFDFTNPDRLFGGAQDNSPMRTTNGDIDGWDVIFGGDGFITMSDPENSDIVYTESQFGNLVKSVENGDRGTFSTALSGIGPADRRNWKTPVVIDPANPTTLYYGTYRLYKSTNRADNWTPISEDLTRGDQRITRRYGTITTISPSVLNDDLIYVGTDDGKVWSTENGGTTWNDLSMALPNRWVTSVAASPFAENEVYVTYSGYRFGEPSGHVYRSADRGQTWSIIDGNLPEVPVNDIIITPTTGHLCLATDIGVFISENDGVNWELLGAELPNVVVNDLDYHAPTRSLLAGTYGRSLYKYTFSPPLATVERPAAVLAATVVPNPLREQGVLKMELAETAGVQLSVFDLNGRMVQEGFSGRQRAGAAEISFGVAGLPAGSYLLRVRVNSEVFALPMVVMK